MQIEVKGRNVQVTDDIREHVERRFEKVAKQVPSSPCWRSSSAEERNPANPESLVAEATLHLKGVTLRAKEASRGHEARDQPRLRRARAPGQAPPRQAPQAPRARAAAAGAAPGRRRRPSGAPGTLSAV